MKELIKNIITKVINNINYFSIIYLVLLVPILYIDKVVNAYFNYDLIKYKYEELLWWLIPFLLLVYLYNIFIKKIKLDIFDYLIYILIVINIIASINAVDTYISFWGTEHRHEGFLTFVTYYLVFLNCKSIKKTKRINTILGIFIGIGVLQFVLSIIQIYFKDLLLPELYYSGGSNMASGFINNPNFMSSYIILMLGIVVVKCLTNEKRWYLYLILTIIFFSNIVLSQSTGPFLGTIVMFLFILIFLIIKKKLKVVRYIILVCFLIASYFTIDYTMSINEDVNSNIKSEYYTINYDLKQLYRAFKGELQTDETTKETGVHDYRWSHINAEDNLDGLGSGRIMIWRNSLKLVPDYLWFGCGIDNFGLVYKWHALAYYDKAHNDFLEILITRGIFALITYLIYLLVLFIKGIKSKEPLAWALVLSIIGYAAQSFTNISIIRVAPYFYMICGLLVSVLKKEKQDKVNPN